MKTHAKASAALFFAAAIPSSPASADYQPQQTPENAQRFLAQYLPGQWTYELVGRGSLVVVRTAAPTASSDNCGTNFRLRFPQGNELDASFGWELIAEVRHAEGSSVVSLIHRVQPTVDHIDFRSPALAARAAFAMEFLRQHCDPAADTGF